MTSLHQRVTRRDFLSLTGRGVGATAVVVAAGRTRAAAATASPYPDWIPASTKPPKRGGTLTLLVGGEDEAVRAASILEAQGYHVVLSPVLDESE